MIHLQRQTITYNYAVNYYGGKFEEPGAKTALWSAEFSNENAH